MAHRGKSLLLVLLSFVLSACASAQAPALRDTTVIAAPPPVPATPEVVSTAASAVVQPAGESGCPNARGPLDGELVFGAGNSLNMIRADGGDLRLLLDLTGTFWAHEPAWSPDGSLLAYMLSQPAPGGDIPGLQTSVICGLERATGAGRLLLRGSTSTEALEEPAWTPDGQSLVVTRRQTTADPETGMIASTVALVRYNLVLGTPQVLVEGASSPALSPDGERLAYIRYDQQTEDVVLVLARADGLEGRLIAETQPPFGVFVAPRWSPDGAELLFVASRGPAATGASPIVWRAVLDTLLGIEVAHAHGDPAALWIVDRDGHNLRALTGANLDDPRAAWAPDGASIAVVAGSGGGVSLLDVATGDIRQLTTGGDYGGISWAPTTQAP